MKKVLLILCLFSTFSALTAQSVCQVNYKIVCAYVNDLDKADKADSLEISKIQQRQKARNCDRDKQLLEKEKLAVCIAREGSEADTEDYKRRMIEAINAVAPPKRGAKSKYIPCTTGDCN